MFSLFLDLTASSPNIRLREEKTDSAAHLVPFIKKDDIVVGILKKILKIGMTTSEEMQR